MGIEFFNFDKITTITFVIACYNKNGVFGGKKYFCGDCGWFCSEKKLVNIYKTQHNFVEAVLWQKAKFLWDMTQ